MKYKFQVGDKVKIRTKIVGFDGIEGVITYIDDDFVANYYEVEFPHEIGGLTHCGRSHETRRYFFFTENELELAAHIPVKIIIEYTPDITTIKRIENLQTTASVTIKRYHSDKADEFTAIKYAAAKLYAIGQTKKPKYYSGKVVCTWSRCPEHFIVGKIYEIKDGRLKSESGLEANHLFTCFEEITVVMTSAHFIELVE